MKSIVLNIAGVKNIFGTKIQLYGPDAHVYLNVEIDSDLKISSSYEISKKIKSEIKNFWPQVRNVVIDLRPHCCINKKCSSSVIITSSHEN